MQSRDFERDGLCVPFQKHAHVGHAPIVKLERHGTDFRGRRHAERVAFEGPSVRDSVRAVLEAFTVPFEGRCAWLYLDQHKPDPLVTAAIGNLADPLPLAVAMPFRVGLTGPLATVEQVAAEWKAVKAMVDLSARGGEAFEAVTRLRLDDEGIALVFNRKRDEFDTDLAKRFASYPSWPADAQLGALSIAWAAGADWAAPKFAGHANARPPDFLGMADESAVHTARDPTNRTLFVNAAQVIAQGLDPDVLVWPAVLTAVDVG